jgi:hypothetical protein
VLHYTLICLNGVIKKHFWAAKTEVNEHLVKHWKKSIFLIIKNVTVEYFLLFSSWVLKF